MGLAQPKKTKRINPLTPIEEVKGLPHVLIIGDSISIGYTLPTRELLKGKVNLHRIPTNGGPTTKGLTEIEKWLGNRKWDLIHFNWGLHDLKYMGKDGTNLVPKEKGGVVQVPLADYEKNLEKLVVRMKKSAKQLVWRNTTPIPPGIKNKRDHTGRKVERFAVIGWIDGKGSLFLQPSGSRTRAWILCRGWRPCARSARASRG